MRGARASLLQLAALLLCPALSWPADLLELYTLAADRDATFQSARFSLDAAQQQRPEAFAALLPSVVASGAASRTYGRTRYTSTPEVNRPFDSDQWSLQLTQPLLRVESLLAYEESRTGVEQAFEQFAQAQSDLLLRVSRAYFDVVLAKQRAQITHEQVTALNEQLLTARRSYAAGIASVTDVDDSQVRVAQAESDSTAADSDLVSTRAVLESIIGEQAPDLNVLRSGAVLPKPDEEVGVWIGRATSDSPRVRSATLSVVISKYELDRVEARRLPSLDLVASYGGSYSSGNITDPANFGSNVRDRQVSLQVSVPLFAGGAIHARAMEAKAVYRKAEADLSDAKRQAALAVQQSFTAVISGLAQLRALEAALQAGVNAVKGNKVGYQVGARINSDVLNAEQQYYSTVQQHEKVRYDTLFQGLQLKAAAGDLTPEDLRSLSRLLEPPGPGFKVLP